MTKKNWMIAILLTIIANSSNLYAQNGQTVKQVKSSEIATSNDLNSDKKILSNSTTQTSIDTKIKGDCKISIKLWKTNYQKCAIVRNKSVSFDHYKF